MNKYYNEIPDALWKKIEPLLPKNKRNLQGAAIVFLKERNSYYFAKNKKGEENLSFMI